MLDRISTAVRSSWRPGDKIASSEARAAGLLVALFATGATFAYIGLIWWTPLARLANGELFDIFLFPAMLGVCLGAQGGYRAVVGTGLQGSSALASAARITIALVSLFLALAVVLALFVAARSLQREKADADSPPPDESFAPNFSP